MVWELVEVAKLPRSGAPVMPTVARSVKRPAPMEVKASVGALMRKFLSRVMLPFAWVLVRARFHCTSGASVEAVRPVSAAPVRVKYGVTPEVRAAGVSATVPVAVRVPPRKVLPATSSLLVGEVVPTPKFPVEVRRAYSVHEEPAFKIKLPIDSIEMSALLESVLIVNVPLPY